MGLRGERGKRERGPRMAEKVGPQGIERKSLRGEREGVGRAKEWRE